MKALITASKRIILFLILVSTFLNACSQGIETPEDLEKEVKNLTDQYLSLNKYASGAITRISYPEVLELNYQTGYSDQGQSTSLTGNELFIAASITKTFVAICILQQMEEDLLTLDDLVSKYVNVELIRKLTTHNNQSYENDLTIEHLLRHQSGIVDYLNEGEVHLNGLNNSPNRNYSLQDRLDFALELDSTTNKIGKYNYSNTNYILLGIIAEKVDQKGISEIIDDRIIYPLGLSNTSLHPTNDKLQHMFRGYFEDRDLTTFTFEFNKNNPAGGILTNVEDLIIFGRAAFSGKLFSSKETLEKMLDFQNGYGLGIMQFEKTRKTGKVIGHSGFDPGYTSYLLYLEKIDVCIVTVINQSELRVDMPAFLPVKVVAAVKNYLN